jgi:lipoprotein-releasing system permease protein
VKVGSIRLAILKADNFGGAQFPFRITGIFESGYSEYDANLFFISFKDSQEIYNNSGYAYGLALKVADPENIDDYLAPIGRVTPYFPWTWKRLNRNKLYSLDNEKMLMMIILFVFFVVVFFNILSTMIAMVLDKREEIGILKAMGLKPKESLYVFLFDGFIMGSAGASWERRSGCSCASR